MYGSVVQSVHQLLPPPYRDVWLEWLDAEQKLKKEAVAEDNKVHNCLHLVSC